MLRMSNETQVTVKILSGLLAAIGLVIFTAAVNSWVKDQTEQKVKVEMIYNYIITAEIKDSLRDDKINRMKIQMDLQQQQTEASISKLYESLYHSQKQLTQGSQGTQFNSN